MICATLLIMSMVFMTGGLLRRNELWDGIFSYPFIKDGSVYPMLKEAMMLLSLIFGEFSQLILLPPHRYVWLMSLS